MSKQKLMVPTKETINLVNWTTKASLSEPLTQIQLAEALLDDAEFLTQAFTAKTLVVDGHYRFNSTPQALEALLNYIKPNAILSKSIDFHEKESYHFKSACAKIEKKYGLSEFGTIGTKNKVTGLRISSLVTEGNQQVHLKKYADVLRAIMKAWKPTKPNLHILPMTKEPCMVTHNCSIELHKLVSDLYNEVNNGSVKA